MKTGRMSPCAAADSLPHLEPDAAKGIGLAQAWFKKRFALSLPVKPAWLLEMEAKHAAGK